VRKKPRNLRPNLNNQPQSTTRGFLLAHTMGKRIRPIPDRTPPCVCFCCRLEFSGNMALFEHLGFVPMGDAVRDLFCACCKGNFESLDHYFYHFVCNVGLAASAELARAGHRPAQT